MNFALKLYELQFFKYSVKLYLKSLHLDSPKLYGSTVALVSIHVQKRALSLPLQSSDSSLALGQGAASSMHTPFTTLHTFVVISLAHENIQLCFY